MYHVVGSGWNTGEDLLSYDEQERQYGQAPEWVWDGEPFDTDVICLHETLDAAISFRDEFRPGCRILEVDVEELRLVHVGEGYPAAQRKISADRLRIVCC